MVDPFAAALDALFTGPGSSAAQHKRGMAAAVPIRVIRGQPDRDASFGSARAVQSTNLFEIRRSEIARPASGDLIIIGPDTFELLGDPLLDVEGLTWTCGAAPSA